MRPRRTAAGFTLVELLVVIAIIGILAGFIAVGLPRAIRAAKLAATKNNMNQIRTILTEYQVDNGTYPPAYGYLSPIFISNSHPITQDYPDLLNPRLRYGVISDLLNSGTIRQQDVFFLLPWMSFIREHANNDLYDNWSNGTGYDTDGDGQISRLEFAPRGTFHGQNQPYTFELTTLYRGAGSVPGDPATAADLDFQKTNLDRRPFIYLPANSRQVRQFANIINPGGNQPNPRPFNLTPQQIADVVEQISFPPPSYDVFVLISVGPNFNSGTNGLIIEFGNNTIDFADFADQKYPEVYQYHILGLATYYLATRDADGDNELDFDYFGRSSRGQAKNPNNDMPGRYPKGDGPIIYVGGK